MVLKSTSIHILEQKQEKKKKKKKKKKRFIVLQSPLFLCEVVFVTGVFITKAGYLDADVILIHLWHIISFILSQSA